VIEPDVRPPADALEAAAAGAMERISSSASFRKARVLRDLLLFLWRNRDVEVGEHQLGIEVLGRRPDFDPKVDATVRVNIARLRQRLTAYYESEGKDETIRFSVPVGLHRISYTRATENSPVLLPVSEPAEKPSLSRSGHWWRSIAIAALAACAALAIHDYMGWQRLQNVAPALHPFWSEALQCRKAYGIIVPSPQFFHWRKDGFVARDFRVNSPERLADSAPLRLLQERLGEPETTQLYTVTTDTLASGEIARYLQDRGVGVDILARSNVSQSLIEERDSILMFAAANTSQYEPFVRPLSLRFERTQLQNLRPQPGEDKSWTGRSYAQDHSVSYGLVSSLPSLTGTTRQLLLVSSRNTSMAALLTSAPLLRHSYEYWNRSGRPQFFEMVIQFEVKGSTTLRAEPVAIHPWAGSEPFLLTH